MCTSHFTNPSNPTAIIMFQSDPLLPSTAFQPLIRALRSVGIWWPEESTTEPWKYTLYSYYSIAVVCLCTHIYTTGQFLFCWTVRDDFDVRQSPVHAGRIT